MSMQSFYKEGERFTKKVWNEVITNDVNATIKVGLNIQELDVRGRFFELQYLELANLLEAAEIIKRES